MLSGSHCMKRQSLASVLAAVLEVSVFFRGEVNNHTASCTLPAQCPTYDIDNLSL